VVQNERTAAGGPGRRGHPKQSTGANRRTGWAGGSWTTRTRSWRHDARSGRKSGC